MKRICIITMLGILISGCVTSTTLYLRDVEVQGPINPPPVQVTTSEQAGKITIAPKFYVLDHSEYRGNIDPSPVKYYDSIPDLYKKENLTFVTPDFYFGIDFDFPVSSNISFIGNVNFSKGKSEELYGGSLGFSFFSLKNKGAFRTSFGLVMQQYAYDASTIVVADVDPFFGNHYQEVSFYHDIDKNTGISLYFNLLYNSDFKEFPLNIYLGLSYFGQELLDFKPQNFDYFLFPFLIPYETDARGEFTMHCINITPGIFFKISDFGRLVVGANIINNLQRKEEKFKYSKIIPTLKLDLFF